MEVSLTFFFFLLTACVSLLSAKGNEGGRVHNTCVDTSANRTALRGGSVTFTCKYPTERRSTSTYKLCKEAPNSACCPLIETFQAGRTKKDRFTLIEDKQRGVYNVTISRLTMNDTGTYRCVMGGSDRICLTQVNLLILNWDDIKPTEKIHETSDTANIMCPYPDDHKSNEKFLCKGEEPFHCKDLINTTEGNKSVFNGRFSIRDNRRLMHFQVNIQNLSGVDSGTYWCGSDRTWQHDRFNKFLLTVAERHIKGGKSDPATEKNATQARGLPADKVVGVIGPVAASLSMLLALVVLLLLVRQKLFRMQGGSSEPRTDVRQNTEGNREDRVYEEIEMENQQGNSARRLLSVYSTVGPPSDQLHYASIVIQKDPAGDPTDDDTLPDTRKNDCEYSSVSRTQGSTHPPPAAEESDFL